MKISYFRITQCDVSKKSRSGAGTRHDIPDRQARSRTQSARSRTPCEQEIPTPAWRCTRFTLPWIIENVIISCVLKHNTGTITTANTRSLTQCATCFAEIQQAATLHQWFFKRNATPVGRAMSLSRRRSTPSLNRRGGKRLPTRPRTSRWRIGKIVRGHSPSERIYVDVKLNQRT